jgi:hypothetical protein
MNLFPTESPIFMGFQAKKHLGHFSSAAPISTNIVKMPRGTKTHFKVWSGHGNNEALLDFAQQLGGLIKCLSYWQAIEEADEAVATAKQALVDASSALKAAKKEESKTQNNASTRDGEKAKALEKKTAASTAVDAAKQRTFLRLQNSPLGFKGATSRRTNRPLGKRSSPI